MESIVFLSNYELDNIEEEQFNVQKPNFGKKLIYFLIVGLGLVSIFICFVSINFIGTFFIYVLPAIILSTIFVPKVFDFVSKRLIQENVAKAIKAYNVKRMKFRASDTITENINALLGLKFKIKNIYYLEGEVKDVDMNDARNFCKTRVLDVISANLGMTFIIGMMISAFIEINSNTAITVLIILLLISFLSPLLVSWLIPVVWTLEDSAIREIDPSHNISKIGNQMRSGLFSKLLGFGGLILGFSFITQNYGEVFTSWGSIGIYLFAGLVLFIAILIIAAPSVLITYVYLRTYHAQNVNACRTTIKKILPIGLTVVRCGPTNIPNHEYPENHEITNGTLTNENIVELDLSNKSQ